MSCGCGCCPKCGCRATCTCNNSIDWSDFESRSEFSYIDEPVKMNTVLGGDDQDRCSSSSFNGDEEFSRGPSDAQGASQAHAKKGTSRGVNNNWEAHYTGAY